jgi:hypothetical protein
MVTRLIILFIHDYDRKRFTREIDWSGPIPTVGSIITWQLDSSEEPEYTSVQWTITKADFVTRLETSASNELSAKVSHVNLVAHYGAT